MSIFSFWSVWIERTITCRYPSEPEYSEKYGWQITISPLKKVSVRKVWLFVILQFLVARYDISRLKDILGS